jgi:hypothetical protein
MKWACLNYFDLIDPNAPVQGPIPVKLFICCAPQMEISHEVPKMPV